MGGELDMQASICFFPVLLSAIIYLVMITSCKYVVYLQMWHCSLLHVCFFL